MSGYFTINIPERYWKPIDDAPKKCREVIIIRDSFGHCDLAYWHTGDCSKGGWSCEFGVCDKPTHFARLSIGAIVI